MRGFNKSDHRWLMKIPLVGIVLFIVFYVIAAYHYPGGSYVHPEHPGFSFQYNYLCDLLDDVAVNGAINSAKIYARISLGLLCFSLLLLWIYLPWLFNIKKRIHLLISTLGVLSMLTTVWLAFGAHDLVVRVAGTFGALALLLTFRQLYLAGYHKLLFLGIISLLLFLANYYIYETWTWIESLPLIQKFTFISCLCWFVLLNVLLLKKFGKD
jgi:hypothetical protein